MLVLRNFHNQVLAKGKTITELREGLAAQRRGKKKGIRRFRVDDNRATWECKGYDEWLPERGYVEPEEYTANQIQAILAEVDFEGWSFVFEPSPSEPITSGKMSGWICAIPPADSEFQSGRVRLDATSTKRQIVQTAYELVREAMYRVIVAPVVSAWNQRCVTGFRYRADAVSGRHPQDRALWLLLGPPAKTKRFTAGLHARLLTDKEAYDPLADCRGAGATVYGG